MELVTTHTHTNMCGHGEGSIRELADAAVAAGITTLAITEHYPLSDAFDPVAYLSMPASRIDEYFQLIDQARIEHPQLEIIAGTELDWLGTDEDRVFAPHEFDRFQLVLGSVHFVDAWPFDDPAQRDRWDEPGAADHIWKRYFALWCDAVMSSQRFEVMSHPDLAKKFNYYPTYDVMPLYRDAAEAAAESGRLVEVNTSGSYYACKQMFPAPELLREFCRAGVPCTVGTDAHTPAHVARDIPQAYRLMCEAGYRTVTVPTATGDRRQVTIEL